MWPMSGGSCQMNWRTYVASSRPTKRSRPAKFPRWTTGCVSCCRAKPWQAPCEAMTSLPLHLPGSTNPFLPGRLIILSGCVSLLHECVCIAAYDCEGSRCLLPCKSVTLLLFFAPLAREYVCDASVRHMIRPDVLGCWLVCLSAWSYRSCLCYGIIKLMSEVQDCIFPLWLSMHSRHMLVCMLTCYRPRPAWTTLVTVTSTAGI